MSGDHTIIVIPDHFQIHVDLISNAMVVILMLSGIDRGGDSGHEEGTCRYEQLLKSVSELILH